MVGWRAGGDCAGGACQSTVRYCLHVWVNHSQIDSKTELTSSEEFFSSDCPHVHITKQKSPRLHEQQPELYANNLTSSQNGRADGAK